MEEKKIVVVGHVSLDLTPKFNMRTKVSSIGSVIKAGKLVNVGQVAIAPGGCVTNTGLALKKFGADVKLIAKVGNDEFAEILYEKYRKQGVEPNFIVSEEDNTSYTIVLALNGCDRAFLHDSAANDSFCEKDIDYEVVRNSDYFHFGYPTLMKEFFREDKDELRKMFKKVKNFGLITSLDVTTIDPDSEQADIDWNQRLSEVLPYVDFFVPSVEELCFMLDKNKYYEIQNRASDDVCMHLSLSEDIVPMAEKVITLGCKGVLIKCGAAGMYLMTSDSIRMKELDGKISIEEWSNKRIFQNSYTPDRILSGTGAGDTSIAAFIYGICKGMTPEDTLRIAAGTGASCITEYDTLSGLLPISILKNKIQNGWKEQNFIHK